MTNQVRRFIEHQEVGVLVQDAKQIIHGWECGLSLSPVGVSLRTVKEKWNIWLATLLMVVFALTRWPGLNFPPNFSATYALAFCAGVYFPRRLAWWLPMVTLGATDLALDLYYYFHLHIEAFRATQLVNYAVYALIIWLGTRFNHRSRSWQLLGGGMLGALVFYLVTNTAAWFFNPFHNPEYVKTLAGWVTALTRGTAGWPQTWEFLWNTLSSGGLFTALCVGAMKASEAVESAREKGTSEEDEGQLEPPGEPQENEG
jgi:hypothetical protein